MGHGGTSDFTSALQGNLKVDGSRNTITFGLKLIMEMKKFVMYKNVKPQ